MISEDKLTSVFVGVVMTWLCIFDLGKSMACEDIMPDLLKLITGILFELFNDVNEGVPTSTLEPIALDKLGSIVLIGVTLFPVDCL